MQQLISEAQRIFPNDPIRQKLVVTQAVLESGLLNGGSDLALKDNNLFGNKGSGTDGTVDVKTQEFENGQYVTITAGFAKNKTVSDSFNLYKQLVAGNSRYQSVMSAGTFEAAARNIQADGYATDPNYATDIINLYNSNIAAYFDKYAGSSNTVVQNPAPTPTPTQPPTTTPTPSAEPTQPDTDGGTYGITITSG